MHRLAGKKLLLLGCLVAFLVMLCAIGLPHSHGTAPGSHSDNCVACRAQSAQPTVDSIAAIGVSPLPYVGTVVPQESSLSFSRILQLFQSRAPPSFSR